MSKLKKNMTAEEEVIFLYDNDIARIQNEKT